MKAFVLFTDKAGERRIMRTRYPRFMASIRNAYDSQCVIASKAFPDPDSNQTIRVCLDECFEDALDSKIEWSLNRAAAFFRNEIVKNG